MSMQRFDGRTAALIDEANAIGTAILRADLLPAEHQPKARELFKTYVDLRIEMSVVDVTKREQRKGYNQRVRKLQAELWDLAIIATNDDPRPITTGVFVKALNDMFDSQAKRNALLQIHVPEVVLGTRPKRGLIQVNQQPLIEIYHDD